METSGLTGPWELLEFPGLKDEEQGCWKIRFLGLKGTDGKTRSPVLKEVDRWRTENKNEFEKLLRSIRYAAATRIHMNQDRIRQDTNKRGGYEIKATRCKCRILFFYHEEEEQLIICTNTYWKGKGGHLKAQDKAFAVCAKMKQQYLAAKRKRL